MAATDIIVSGLTAQAAFGLNFLTWDYTDPNVNGWPDFQLDKVIVYASTSNNRAVATEVAKGTDNAIHVVTDGGARYYWARARNRIIGPAGERYYGEWHPLSATAGVAASATGLLADNAGYVKLPGGIIIQWGEANGAVTFPIPFPTRIMSLACDLNWPGHYMNQICKVVNTANRDRFGFSPQQFTVQSDVVGSPTVEADLDWPFRWIAIGH